MAIHYGPFFLTLNKFRIFFSNRSINPLTLPVLTGRRDKINLNFYSSVSIANFEHVIDRWEDLHKTFWSTADKCENKNLS